MADINISPSGRRIGFAKSKKLSTRIDLTPMVDLGFLLITFFIFTTSLSQPKAMTLHMPADTHDSSQVPESKTLTLILCKSDSIWYYTGAYKNSMQKMKFLEIRNIIQNKKHQLKAATGADSTLIVLIKPTQACSYSNVVNALDEMLICTVGNYILTDINDGEMSGIKRF